MKRTTHRFLVGLGASMVVLACGACTARTPANGAADSSPNAVSQETTGPVREVPDAPERGNPPPGPGPAQAVGQDENVVLTTTGDVNGDGLPDVLTVIDHGDPSRERALVIVAGTADRTPGRVARGDSAVLCRSCGGLAPDPLSAIITTGRGFDLSFEGGSREQWGRRFHFEWAPEIQGWRLTGYFTRVVDAATGQLTEQARPVPDVTLERFNAANFID